MRDQDHHFIASWWGHALLRKHGDRLVRHPHRQICIYPMKILTHSPRAAVVFSLLAVVTCGIIWWQYLKGPNGPDAKWGYDLTTGELFRVAITAVPPYAAPSGADHGVDALGVNELNGVRSATALRMYSPEAATVIKRMVEPEGIIDDPRAMMDTVHRGTHIRRIADTEWTTEMSPAGMAILHEILPAPTPDQP